MGTKEEDDEEGVVASVFGEREVLEEEEVEEPERVLERRWRAGMRSLEAWWVGEEGVAGSERSSSAASFSSSYSRPLGYSAQEASTW